MCVLGWLNHHHCLRFQREVAVPFWTVTGHPLQLNTVIINYKPACMSHLCADISGLEPALCFVFGNNAATCIFIRLNQ